MRRVLSVLVVSVLLVGFLFVAVLPTRTYIAQHRQLEATKSEVAELARSNSEMTRRVEELHTDAEIERIAREQYNLVRPGEAAYALLPAPAPPPPTPEELAAAKAAEARAAEASRSFWDRLFDDLSFWE